VVTERCAGLYTANNTEIFSVNSDGSAQTNLTNNAAADSNATWSPDGASIVFSTDRDGNGEIYRMATSGSAQSNLSMNPGQDSQPRLSPDGASITFTSTRSGAGTDVWLMSADGADPVNLTGDSQVGNGPPAWLPCP
jgi:Tol biopolymer transport system component